MDFMLTSVSADTVSRCYVMNYLKINRWRKTLLSIGNRRRFESLVLYNKTEANIGFI
jgi:hypothetical protein